MNHGKILAAYLTRLSSGVLQEIAEMAKTCDTAQLQWGINAQLQAQNELTNKINCAIDKMSAHDLAIIQEIIEKQ